MLLSIDAWLDEKPYKEVFDGVIHEKMSPQSDHWEVAGELIAILKRWAGERGGVGPELRVYLAPGVSLVPDVAFMSDERRALLPKAERAKPTIAPKSSSRYARPTIANATSAARPSSTSSTAPPSS